MAAIRYSPAAVDFGKGNIDLVNNTLRLILVMTNTTADTETDKHYVANFTTLDEYDGANYARKTLAGKTFTEDVANIRGELQFTAVTYSALGAGTRAAQGVVLIKFVTNDADSIAIAFFPFSSNFTGNGGDLTLTPDAEGFLQIRGGNT